MAFAHFRRVPTGCNRVPLFELAIKYMKTYMFVQQLGRVPSGCKRVPLEKHGKTYMYSHVSACSQANAWLTEASHSGSQPQAATGGCGQVHPGAALGGNGVEPVIALKHIKIFSFCIIPAGADRVRAGTSRSTCIQVYKKTSVSQDVDRVPIRCKRVLMEKPKWCDPLKAAAAHFPFIF